jgi:hypothetical protein
MTYRDDKAEPMFSTGNLLKYRGNSFEDAAFRSVRCEQETILILGYIGLTISMESLGNRPYYTVLVVDEVKQWSAAYVESRYRLLEAFDEI